MLSLLFVFSISLYESRPGGTGLLDPCEKEACDVLSGLTLQQREDITSSAQV